MKQFKVVALSSKNNLLVLDSENNSFEYPIQGFKVVPSLSSRLILGDLIGKTLDCTLNKAGTHIRYQNQKYLGQKIEAGALEVIPKELEQTKVFNAQQKSRIAKYQKNAEVKPVQLVDVCSNRRQMLRLFPRGGEIKGNVEWLHEEIVVSTQLQGKLTFLPIRLKNINTLFQCLPQSNYTKFIQENPKLSIKIERPIYNLVKKRFELIGIIKPELQLRFLSYGWAIINSAALASVEGLQFSAYLKAERQAKQAHIGVFSRNCEILAFIYAKNNFVGEVSDVFDGYIFQVTKRSGGKVKLELAMVRCPVGDQPGAFNCREFARKQLIGQEVNVYLQKDSGLNITGSLIRAKDSKDIEALLVEQGWGFVREQFINSILCIKLNQLERKTKQKGKGLYSKDIGVHRPQDLTVPNTHKQDIYYDRREEILKKASQNQVGVFDGLVDLMTYRVWLQDKNVILKVKLQGVQGHNINPLLDEVKKMKEDLKQLCENKFKKRSVNVTLTGYQRESNSYNGTIIFQGGKTLQQILLQQSLVYAEREGGAPQLYKEVQKKVRNGGRGLWGPKLINFQPINPLQLQNQKFRGKFSWVQDGQTVYIQPQSNFKQIHQITAKLQSKQLRKATKDQIVAGSLLAAPYYDEFYRALIISIKGKKIRVVFIDWGNKQFVEEGNLYELPEELRFVQKQCFKAKLYLTKPIRSEQYLERIRGELMNGEEFQFKKETGEYVSTYRNKQNIVLSLIERGLVKGNTDMASASLRETIMEFESNLRRDRVGVWEWIDEEEEMMDQDEND